MKNSVSKKLAFFFVCPFLSSLMAVKNIKSQSSLIIICAFFLLFGLSFTPVNEKADSFRYAEDFRTFEKSPDDNFKSSIRRYTGDKSIGEESVKDLYIVVMYYVSSKIGGNNIHVLFFLFAVVFVVFYIGSLKIVLSNRNFQLCTASYILVAIFLYSNNIFNINGVRFWTASWMAVYTTYKIVLQHKKKWFIGLMLLPLVHISYIVYILIFLIAYTLKNKTDFLFRCFLVSFFLGQFGLLVLNSIKGQLPILLQNMIWNYTESEMAKTSMSGGDQALYATILMALPRYFELLLLFIIGWNRKKLSVTPMMGFTLAFFSFVNIFSMIPSLGGRFYTIGYPFIIYLWIDNLPFLQRYNMVLKLSPIIYAYHIFRWIRTVLSVTPLMLYISNFFHIVAKSFF